MRILIRFEDNYGCCTLFKYSKSVLNHSSEHDIEIEAGLCDSVVFSVSPSILNLYDYVLIVFDLDSITPDCCILTGNSLRRHLGKRILKDGHVKDEWSEKIILIPVFICFETIYLFSRQMQSVISNIQSYKDSRETALIGIYKKYYDYSLISPECLYNIENHLDDIKQDEYLIKGLQSKNKWTPQKFHLKYSEQLLRLVFKNVLNENQNGKIFIKHEDLLFKEIDELESPANTDIFVSDIIRGMNKCVHNRKFYKLLTLTCVEQLKEMTLSDHELDILCKELDDYHLSLKGTKKDFVQNNRKI